MSFDGFFTKKMVTELDEQLSGGRISKIHQPYQNEVVLIVRNNGKNHKLLLSAHPSFARIHLTNMDYDNPATPPNFCMMLRKYLESVILEQIKQIDNDRVIHFTFSRRNELGDLEDIVLIVELMGRHSTIVLVNQHTGKILDCIKHVGTSQNSYRLLLPGTNYIAPPVNTSQYNPFAIPQTKLFELLSQANQLDATFIQTHFQGIGFDTATEISHRLTEHPMNKLDVWQTFFSNEQLLSPNWYQIAGKDYFSAIALTYLGEPFQSFVSLSELLDTFYAGKAERDRVKQQASFLIKKITNDYKKNKKKLEKLEKERLATESADKYKIIGELLTTYLYLVKPNQTVIELPNYYNDEQPVTIQLSPQLTPSQNAQKYFKRYNKLKTGASIIEEQIQKTKQEDAYLESVMSQIDLASPTDIDVIKEELLASGYIKEKQKNRKKNKPSQPEKFYSSNGDEILVGKNNLQNDQLTFKLARKNDIWLHAKDIPGSHVIIKNSTPTDETLYEAACLAAYFSKYRLSSQVPVDFVSVKHIKKPNGAKPGFVIYENQQTLYVTPDPQVVTQLKKSPS